METAINSKCIGGNSSSHLHVITGDMLRIAISKLNKGKSDTSNIISTNSFINAHPIMGNILAGLFTVMLTHGFSCNILNLIRFSPLIKNKRSIVKHCVDTDHAVDINNKIILHFEPDTNRRKLIESVLIHNNSNFNTQRTNYKLDCLSNSILTKHIQLFNKLGSDIKNHNERCFLNDVT